MEIENMIITKEAVEKLVSLMKGKNKIINPIDGTNIVHGTNNLTYEIDATTKEKITGSEAGDNNLITGQGNAITYSANNSIVGGKNNKIKSDENLVVGNGNAVTPAEDKTNSNSGVRNIISGYKNQLNGANNSILAGQNNIVNAGDNFIIGVSNKIYKNYTLTLGESNMQSGTKSLIIGTGCSTNGPYEIVIGNDSCGAGRCQLVLGDNLKATAGDAIVTQGLTITNSGTIYQENWDTASLINFSRLASLMTRLIAADTGDFDTLSVANLSGDSSITVESDLVLSESDIILPNRTTLSSLVERIEKLEQTVIALGGSLE